MGALFSQFYKRCIGGREVRFIMLGLDGAGKTTILYKLALNEIINTLPTIGFNVETVICDRYKMCIWDIGGQEYIRKLWRNYLHDAQGIIYVVDSNDIGRVEKARDELHSLLEEDELRDSILLVIANKQDLPDSIKPQELSNLLRLNTIKNRKWLTIGVCAITAEGLHEGFNWLCKQV